MVPTLELNSDKMSLRDQTLAICLKVYEKATYIQMSSIFAAKGNEIIKQFLTSAIL